MKPRPLPLYAYESGYTLRGIPGTKRVHVKGPNGEKYPPVVGIELVHANIDAIIAETRRPIK